MLTLLSQYFASSVPGEVMKAIADDWNDALKGYPAWAINRACRWWIGPENTERRKRPLPGDIADRAKREMGLVKMAKRSMAQSRAKSEEKPRPTLTDEQRQRMQKHVERLFPTLKRMEGEQ